MKNLKSFPFERNRYFYGKLLSVEDFETEQKYFNDKRRTINRFLFGSGVVCGLGVVEVDDESISVERGLALDFAGREIVLDEPAVRKITELEGYGGEQDADFYYLCLEYQEETAANITSTKRDTACLSHKRNRNVRCLQPPDFMRNALPYTMSRVSISVMCCRGFWNQGKIQRCR